ncbi:hypothetical protein IM538_14680 [Cytobacillus suaedae]|nr:hypothetical protein IM538_14680 [Cytobacillus suaedae]
MKFKYTIITLSVLLLFACSSQESTVVDKKQEKISDTVPVEAEVSAEVTYLNDHSEEIDYSNLNDLSDLHLLDSEIESYNMFFTGESHSVQLNYPVQLKLLKYLHQKAGVTYYLAELPYATGQFYNQYLQTGDESLLELTTLEADHSHIATVEAVEFVKSIYQYNQSLNGKEPIRFVAIDADSNLTTSFRYLDFLTKDLEVPLQLQGMFTEIKTIGSSKIDYNSSHTPETTSFARKLNDDLLTNEQLYKDFLGVQYDEFKFVVENTIRGIEAFETFAKKGEGDFNVLREGYFTINFERNLSLLNENAKFFGEWGRNHTYLKTNRLQTGYSQNIPRFAQVLNEQIDYTKGKVLSIPYVYHQSELTNMGQKQSIPFKDNLLHKSLLIDSAKGDVTLYKLTGDNSPFDQSQFFVGVSKTKATTDYFQYLILIQNSEGATPYFAD